MPGPFRFRLQKVLVVRKYKEDLVKNELARVTKVYNEERRSLENQTRAYRRALDELKEKERGVLSIHEIVSYHMYISGLSLRIKAQEMRVSEIEEEIVRVRGKLVEASKERKSIEKLRDKHYQTYLQEINKIEQDIIDEVASNVFIRGGGK